MKALFTLATLALTCLTATARQLSASEAYALGATMVPSQSRVMSINSASAAAEPVVTMSEGDINTVYAFNRAEGGYVVVAADDESPVSVLGWSDAGSLPAVEDMPDNLKFWFESFSQGVAAAAKGGADVVSPRRTIAAGVHSAVAPLIKTTWGQLAPYNGKTPVVNGSNTPAGCVAVAVAQVMNYYSFPMSGTGSKNYSSQGVRHNIDFSTVNFGWDKMKNTFANSADADANEAVAELVYTVGVSAKTTYTASASSASMNTAAAALVTNFGYDKNVRLLNREYYTLEGWMNIIHSELAAGRPVLYTGSNSTIGHAFIADGYTSTSEAEYLHINWGWDGYSNGYFAVLDMNPTIQGVGGSTSGYNASQTIVVGLQPDQDDTYTQPVAEWTGDFNIALNGNNVRVSDQNGIFLMQYSKAATTFGVCLTNAADGSKLYIAEDRVRNLIRGSAVTFYEMQASLFPTEGVWTVEPAVRDEQGNWITDGLVKMSKSRTSTLVADANGLTFINGTAAEATADELSLLSPVFSGKTFGVGATLTTDDEEYYNSVMPVLYKDGTRVATGPAVMVHLYSGESKYMEWVGKFNSTFAPGQYTMSLIEADGTPVSAPVDVTVEATPEATPEVYLAVDMGNGISGFSRASQNRPEEVSFEPLTMTVYIECVSGYYAENIAGVIFQGTQGIVKLPEQFVGIKAGETAELTFEYTGSELQSGVVYNLKTLASNSQQYIGQPTYFCNSLAAMDQVSVDAASAEYVQYFNLNGVEVINPTEPGLYVAIAADGTSHKIAIR